MSIDYSLYVGPYVKCAITIRPVKKMRRTCTRPSCEAYRDVVLKAKFCSACGCMVADRKVVVEEKAEFDPANDFHLNKTSPMDDYSGSWCSDNNCDLYIVDYYNLPEKVNSWPEYELLDVHELEIKDIQKQISDFVRFWEVEIKKLREVYGEENVRICWGFMGSCG